MPASQGEHLLPHCIIVADTALLAGATALVAPLIAQVLQMLQKPVCTRCDKRAEKTWFAMTDKEKNGWVVTVEGTCCKGCVVQQYKSQWETTPKVNAPAGSQERVCHALVHTRQLPWQVRPSNLPIPPTLPASLACMQSRRRQVAPSSTHIVGTAVVLPAPTASQPGSVYGGSMHGAASKQGGASFHGGSLYSDRSLENTVHGSSARGGDSLNGTLHGSSKYGGSKHGGSLHGGSVRSGGLAAAISSPRSVLPPAPPRPLSAASRSGSAASLSGDYSLSTGSESESREASLGAQQRTQRRRSGVSGSGGSDPVARVLSQPPPAALLSAAVQRLQQEYSNQQARQELAAAEAEGARESASAAAAPRSIRVPRGGSTRGLASPGEVAPPQLSSSVEKWTNGYAMKYAMMSSGRRRQR